MTARKEGRPRTPIEHGTEAGYKKHLRYGPPVNTADSCGCRRANREATYRRMAKLPPPPPRKRVRKRHEPIAVQAPPTKGQAVTAPIAPTYIATLPAAKAVVLGARNAAEARELLQMLGLVSDGAIVPDDVRNYDVPGAGPEAPTHATSADNPTKRDLHPERCSTPAGLRWVS